MCDLAAAYIKPAAMEKATAASAPRTLKPTVKKQTDMPRKSVTPTLTDTLGKAGTSATIQKSRERRALLMSSSGGERCLDEGGGASSKAAVW